MTNFFDNLREAVNYFNANKDYYEDTLRNQTEAEAQPLDMNERVASILGDYRGWTLQETSMDPEKDVEWKSRQGRPYITGVGKFAPADRTYSDEGSSEGIFYWNDDSGDLRAGRIIFQSEDAFNDSETPTRVYGAILDDGTTLSYSKLQELFNRRGPTSMHLDWQTTSTGENGKRVLNRSEMDQKYNQQKIKDIVEENRKLRQEYNEALNRPKPQPEVPLAPAFHYNFERYNGL